MDHIDVGDGYFRQKYFGDKCQMLVTGPVKNNISKISTEAIITEKVRF